jgi:23S rRNA (uridine2552-2'-O)-methyltransferase
VGINIRKKVQKHKKDTSKIPQIKIKDFHLLMKKTNKLQKAKRLKNSSRQWILRQINDPFVKKAQDSGFRSRSTFKIIEIDEKFKIFKKGKIVIDLGAAPGGWSEIAVQKCGQNRVFGIDLLEIDPVLGAFFIKGDFLEEETVKKVLNLIEEKTGRQRCDVLLSDMAANTTGDKRLDHMRIVNLLEEALFFGQKTLNIDGCFVGKLFQGAGSDEILKILRANFKTVKYFKPDSSRKDSSEVYLVALGFKNS